MDTVPDPRPPVEIAFLTVAELVAFLRDHEQSDQRERALERPPLALRMPMRHDGRLSAAIHTVGRPKPAQKCTEWQVQ